MNEEVVMNEVEETVEVPAAALEPEIVEPLVPEYLVPTDELPESSDQTDDSVTFTTGEKLALGAVGLGVAAAGFGIAAGIKKIRSLKKAGAEGTEETELGPKPIPDSKPNARAIRGRKITLRERLTGHLYLDPDEVEMMQKAYAVQNAGAEES